MTFKSKRTITDLIAGTALTCAYVAYALSDRTPKPDDLTNWARTMLAFIGIAVGVTIIIQIAFHIVYSISVAVKERERNDKEVERIIAAETAEDELDKLISLKSSRAGYICMGAGFVAVLVTLSFFNASPVTALHILFASIIAGSGLEGFISILFYEKGVK